MPGWVFFLFRWEPSPLGPLGCIQYNQQSLCQVYNKPSERFLSAPLFFFFKCLYFRSNMHCSEDFFPRQKGSGQIQGLEISKASSSHLVALVPWGFLRVSCLSFHSKQQWCLFNLFFFFWRPLNKTCIYIHSLWSLLKWTSLKAHQRLSRATIMVSGIRRSVLHC